METETKQALSSSPIPFSQWDAKVIEFTHSIFL